MNRPTLRRRAAGDGGFSLAEVLISMAIMSVVMAVVSTGLSDMFRTTDTAEASATAQAQLQATFNKLDREVRYATRISAQYADTDTYYIDFVYRDDAGASKCVQLSLPRAGGTLMRREWPQQNRPDAAATAVANNLISARLDTSSVPPQVINPFVQLPANDGISYFDRLDFKVNSVVGNDLSKQGVREYDLQFTAINTVSRVSQPLVCNH